MTRKALARRITEVLFNEPATRRVAGAAQPERLRGFWPVLCCSSVKGHGGYSTLPAPCTSQNSQRRSYTSLKPGALAHLSQLARLVTREAAPEAHRGQKVCTTGAMS